MRRLGAEYAGEVALAGAYRHALGEHHLLPPAAERLELEKALIIDARHHEAHFVHVPSDQHAGPALLVDASAALVGHDGAETVGHYLAERGQIASHYLAHRALCSGHAGRFGQLLQHLQSVVHCGSFLLDAGNEMP